MGSEAAMFGANLASNLTEVALLGATVARSKAKGLADVPKKLVARSS